MAIDWGLGWGPSAQPLCRLGSGSGWLGASCRKQRFDSQPQRQVPPAERNGPSLGGVAGAVFGNCAGCFRHESQNVGHCHLFPVLLPSFPESASRRWNPLLTF